MQLIDQRTDKRWRIRGKGSGRDDERRERPRRFERERPRRFERERPRRFERERPRRFERERRRCRQWWRRWRCYERCGRGRGAATGGSSGAGGVAGAGSDLPWLTVKGNKLQDPTGKTIILRGSSLIDIGSLYWYGGQSVAGITARMDKVAAAGVQGHVIRLPVYPKVDYNTGGDATCSPCPYPVGTGPTASCTPKSPLSAADYVAKVLKPAVDYATSKNLYVIIDYHQIDNATLGNIRSRREDVLDRHRAQVRGRQQRPLRTVQRTNRRKRALVGAEAGRAAADRHHSRRRAQEHHHRAVEHLGSAPRRRGQRSADRHAT